MAVSKASFNSIPSDAVELTPDEAYAYQWKLIVGWDKTSEIWSLKFAPGILGISAALSGMLVNNHYRKKLKLGEYGRLSTYLPIVVIPAITTILYHRFFIQKDIILEQYECPTCLQLRAAAFQSTLGVIYPCLLSPLSSFMFATRHYTFRLPSITEKPLEVLALWFKMTKPLASTIGVVFSLNALLAMYITYKESQHYAYMQLKLQALEDDLLLKNEKEER